MPDEKEQLIKLADSAREKIAEFQRMERDEFEGLRIAVQPGGCSGLRYSMYFDSVVSKTDTICEYGDVKILVDKMSAVYLRGTEIDYVDTIQSSGFAIKNPNAAGTCACGDSFH